jgi:hypothetical protein
MRYLEVAGHREHKESEKLEGMFRRVLTPMIESPFKAKLFKLIMWGAFLFTCTFFYFNWVAVKMLPLDNKPEFAVVLDMPEGTALPVTANMAHRMAEKVRAYPEVTAVQVYAGTARPFDFNGMVRHYYMRKDPWHAEVQIQLLHKSERDRTSHEIAVRAREDLKELVQGTGAKYAVVEMPPGPPVLQSVVAEVHGPSAEVRRQVASDLTQIFSQAESLRDVDNYMRDPYQYWRFTVDAEKSVRRGISVDTINRNLGMALGGSPLGDVKQRSGHEPVNIVMQVPMAERSEITRLGDLPIQSQTGITVPLRELGKFEQVREDDIIFHKDLRAVEYVVADVGGRLAAPVYGMFQVQDILAEQYQAPDGVALDAYWLGPPKNDSTSSIEWTGEWTVTFETFRDMGAAFMVALVLIYVLVVWEFGNFRIPALIMAPIPLTLLGIIPAHFLFFQAGWGGEFTATSMIGWIALAGIIVRNSILLVDFSIHEIQHGSTVVEAVIQACKTRTRPIMITAFALVCGSSVIFFDQIFQGMAISLASGVLVSTVLTLVVIPLGCIKASKDLIEVAAATAPAGVEIAALETISTPSEVKPEAAPVPAVAKTPVWFLVWGKLIGAITLVFYLIRGIFLLLAQLFKKKKKSGGTPPAQSGSGGSSSGSGPSGGSGMTPGGVTAQPAAASPVDKASQAAPATAAAVVADKSSVAKQDDSAVSATPTAPAETVKESPSADKESASAKAGSKSQTMAAAVESAPADPGAEETKQADAQSLEVKEKAAEAKPVAEAPKPRKRPSTLKPAVKSSASSASKGNGNGVTKAGDSTKRPKTSAPNVTAMPVRKKASRRGIRLKT